MEQQITVEKVERKEKSGSLLANGRWFKVPLNLVSNYTVGRTYSVDVEESPYNGNTYYWLKKTPKVVGAAEPSGPATPPPINGSYNQTPAPTPSRPMPEDGRQVLIVAQVILKILADGQNLGGNPIQTQDMPTLIAAAVAMAKDMVSKV